MLVKDLKMGQKFKWPGSDEWLTRVSVAVKFEDKNFYFLDSYFRVHGATMSGEDNVVVEDDLRVTIPVGDPCIHTGHCCVEHGCKYGDVDCPVWLAAKKQGFPCESCNGKMPLAPLSDEVNRRISVAEEELDAYSYDDDWDYDIEDDEFEDDYEDYEDFQPIDEDY